MQSCRIGPLHSYLQSPVGPLLLTGDERSLWSLSIVPPGGGAGPAGERREAAVPFVQARGQLEQYFAGERTAFELPLRFTGSEFQRIVWRALLGIPYGETRSYGELAAAIGRPRAARATGLANGRNPFAIVVPCHRLIGAAGGLVGYRGGLERKRWLLDHERRVRSAGEDAVSPGDPLDFEQARL